MTTQIKPLTLETGKTASFISNETGKQVSGTIIKINNKTAILEVKQEITVIDRVKGVFGGSKDKKSTVLEVRLIKRRLNSLSV